MRTIYITFLLLLQISFSFGLEGNLNNNEIISLEVQINGENRADVTIILTAVSPSKFHNQIIELKTNPDGYIRFSLTKYFPVQEISIRVKDGLNIPVLVQNGLRIEIDNQLEQNIGFSGPDSEMNRFMDKYRNQVKQFEFDGTQFKDNSERFLAVIDSVFFLQEKEDSKFLSKNPTSYAFIIDDIRKSNYYSYLLLHYWSSGNSMEVDKWEEVRAHNPILLNYSSSYFFYCLHTYIKKSIIFPKYIFESKPHFSQKDWQVIMELSKSSTTMNSLGSDELIERYIVKINTFLLMKISDYCDQNLFPEQAELVKMPANITDDLVYKLYYEKVLSKLKCESLRNEAKRIYTNKIINVKELRTEMKKTLLIDSNYSLGKHILNSEFGAELYVFTGGTDIELLRFVKGLNRKKNIFLDFWAVWCDPCIKAMPHSKRLKEQVDDLGVEFIYICTNNNTNEDAWIRKIMELRQPGIHIYIQDKVMRSIFERFQLMGYPSYLLVNQNFELLKRVDKIEGVSKDELFKRLK